MKLRTLHFLTTVITTASSFLFPKDPFTQPHFADGPGDGTLVYLDEGALFRTSKSLVDNLAFQKFILPSRPIRVWLPPSYRNQPTKRYPVIYCHDGQNAINDEESWTGHSWRLGGALTDLIRRSKSCKDDKDCAKLREPIVVLIDSIAEDFLVPGVRRRHLEYGDGPIGEAYTDAIVSNLKPRIDSQFRTLTGVNDTLSLGSSLGGQVSFSLFLKYPEVFGGAAGLSPCFQPKLLSDVATEGATKLRGKRIYMDNGGDSEDIRVPLLDPLDHLPNFNPGYFWLDTQLQPSIDAMRFALNFHNLPFEYKRYPGGRHNEREWARRIDKALLFLLKY